MKKKLIMLSTIFAWTFTMVNIQADFLSDVGGWAKRHQKELGIGLGVAAGLGAAGAASKYAYNKGKKSIKKPEIGRPYNVMDLGKKMPDYQQYQGKLAIKRIFPAGTTTRVFKEKGFPL